MLTNRPLLLTAVALAASTPSWSSAATTATSTSRATVRCDVGHGTIDTLVKPKHCAFIAEGGTQGIAADSVEVDRLKWRNWGRKVTTATGHLASGGGSYSVKIKLTKPVRCNASSPTIYRRMRVTSKGNAPYSFTLFSCD